MFWFFEILLCECSEVVHIPKYSSARSNDTQQYNFLGRCVSFRFFVKSVFMSMRGQWQRCYGNTFIRYLSMVQVLYRDGLVHTTIQFSWKLCFLL